MAKKNMMVSIIVAVAENNVIGKNNDLIWHLPKDMQFFKQTTLHHHIITGRKNYISIPVKFRPLANRTNIVLTRQQDFPEEGCVVLNSLEAAIKFAKQNNENEVFIIGGGQIYKEALEKNLVDKLYVTHVHHSFDGDTFDHLNSDGGRMLCCFLISRIRIKISRAFSNGHHTAPSTIIGWPSFSKWQLSSQ